MEATADGRTVLYVRSLAPSGAQRRQAAVIDQLRTLAERDVLDQVEIQVWGKRIDLSRTAARTDTGRGMLDKISRFKAWADTHGYTLEPVFETRHRASSITGEAYTSLVLPTMLLVEYVNDEVRHVTPHQVDQDDSEGTDGTETTTCCGIDDRLDVLADGNEGASDPARDKQPIGAGSTLAE